MFRCLLTQVDFNNSDGRGNSGKDGQQLQLLMQEATSVVTRPNFVSILCYGFENQENRVNKSLSLSPLPVFLSVCLFVSSLCLSVYLSLLFVYLSV